jgi:hypothetical protein
MKTLIITLKIFAFVLLFTNTSLYAEGISETTPTYDKVYRSDRIGDSYYFLILTKSGKYYHLYTNRTDKITKSELKSPNLLEILKKKQSWGKSFPKKGKYIIDSGKIYTKLLWDRIKVVSSKKIKYLNKTFKLQ